MQREILWMLALLALMCASVLLIGGLARLLQWSVSQALCSAVWGLRTTVRLLFRTARWTTRKLQVGGGSGIGVAGKAWMTALHAATRSSHTRREGVTVTPHQARNQPSTSQERREPHLDDA